MTGDDLNDVLEVLYKINGDFNYLFIDEIQNIPEWYLFCEPSVAKADARHNHRIECQTVER